MGPEGTAGEWAGVGTGSVRSLYLRTQVRGPHDWGHPGHSWGSWAGGHVPAGRQGKEKGTRQAWGTGSRCPVGLEQHPRVPWPFRFPACLAALPGRPLVSPMCGSGGTLCRQPCCVGHFLFLCSSCFSLLTSVMFLQRACVPGLSLTNYSHFSKHPGSTGFLVG